MQKDCIMGESFFRGNFRNRVLSQFQDDDASEISTCAGTEYVDEFLEMEDKCLQKASTLYKTVKGSAGGLDQVSLTTVSASNLVFDEEQQKIYKTYDLKYTSNKNMTITQFQDRIVSMIETNPVTIIQGPTGCGKTTQVPQFILDSCYRTNAPCNIIVTQPRRLAAMSIAKRVSTERDWPCGALVGYKVGLINKTTPDTRLTYCTTGVLLQRLITSKHMNDFTHIILDEIHERDQDMDFLLLIVRKFLRSNSRGVRVILMSATFNVERFSKYFSFYAGDKLIQGPIIHIHQKNHFLVREFYLEDIRLGPLPEVDLNDAKASREMLNFSERLLKIMDNLDEETDRFGNRSDLERPAALVFLPGIHEIEELHTILDHPSNDSLKWDILILHSSITHEEQSRIFEEPPEGHRRIILSTNIAESSLTVPNVKYVIDFCLTKQLVTDPSTNYHTLELTWASKANCQQRAGRTGRVMDGRVYRLVPRLFYKQDLPDENPPEIVRAPLENIYLRAKLLNMEKPVALLALCLDPPDLTNIHKTVLNLKETGALLAVPNDPLDGDLTDLGRVMGHLPLEIHISKLIVLGHVFSVLKEAVIIGASMSAKNMFNAPYREKLQAYRAKLLWANNTNSDGIAFLNAFRAWSKFKVQNSSKEKSSENAWARRGFLQIRVLREVEASVAEIISRLISMGIRDVQGEDRVKWEPREQEFVLKVIIAGAFYPNFYLASARTDERTSVKELGGLDPSKTVYLTGWPHTQPGPLYAKRFQEIFKGVLGADSSSIGVKFDHSSRVYLQFNKTEVRDQKDMPELCGEIPVAVYQAIKLRSIWGGVEIRLMDVLAANARADEMNVQRGPINLYMPRPRRAPEGMGYKMRPRLPALDLTSIPIVIQRVVDPGHFWVSNDDSETRENLRKVRKIIGGMGELEVFQENPKVGSVVLAPKDPELDEQRLQTVAYDRAIVQSVSLVSRQEYKAQVFFMDSGVVSSVRVADLRVVQVGSLLGSIPAAAFQCVLSHVKPAILNTMTGQWSERAKQVFEDIVSGRDKSICAEVYSVVNSVVSVTLHVSTCTPITQGTPTQPTRLQVNHYLIDKGYADFRDEDYLSKTNHTLREDVMKLSVEERLTHEDLQYSQLNLSDSYVYPPDESECTTSVTLKGPDSPLEVKLSNLIDAGVGSSISIDQASVNSVLLDSNLNDPKPRLVVAGSVAQGFSSGNLTLRNTTLMPSVPGLTHILALIFAPRIELRANKMKTRNVGALCGLGPEVNKRKSIYPEHDMTLNFDVDISIDDLQNINRLRYWMSMGILVDDEEEKDDAAIAGFISKVQGNVSSSFWEIMNRKRGTIAQETEVQSRWCKYPEEEFIEPPEVGNKNLIYKLHRALDLQEKDDARENMMEHLGELRQKASMRLRETPYEEIHCRLCDQVISGILQLRNHITSGYHGAKELELRGQLG